MSKPASARRAVNGVLLLDKPTGITSNAAIQRVKRLFAAEKAGHVGTLDPMAGGLLPVCLGEATKFSTDLFDADKSYRAEVLLGVTTDTGDREGEITSRHSVNVTRDELAAVLVKFTGPLAQTPPMYSALKRDGKPLYEYARAGVTLERAPRSITIHSMALLNFAAERFSINVSCTKGTYIRVLAEDIGAALGCGATLAGLTRTRVGSFDLVQAVTLAALEQMPEAQKNASLLAVDCLAAGLPALALDAGAVTRILQGQVAQVEVPGAGAGRVRLYGPEGRFLGLAELDRGGRLLPKRLIATSKVAAAARDGHQQAP
ncbi:MAG: tRNA pseudouridine(55) synthase TruB, partial [Betaproteobacteria bacterium]